jgi:hypothetical protein
LLFYFGLRSHIFIKKFVGVTHRLSRQIPDSVASIGLCLRNQRNTPC